MPISPCSHCGCGQMASRWSDAFMKHGYDDGNGPVMTYEVCQFLIYSDSVSD
jgi:hypothetical protein